MALSVTATSGHNRARIASLVTSDDGWEIRSASRSITFGGTSSACSFFISWYAAVSSRNGPKQYATGGGMNGRRSVTQPPVIEDCRLGIEDLGQSSILNPQSHITDLMSPPSTWSEAPVM